MKLEIRNPNKLDLNYNYSISEKWLQANIETDGIKIEDKNIEIVQTSDICIIRSLGLWIGIEEDGSFRVSVNNKIIYDGWKKDQ